MTERNKLEMFNRRGKIFTVGYIRVSLSEGDDSSCIKKYRNILEANGIEYDVITMRTPTIPSVLVFATKSNPETKEEKINYYGIDAVNGELEKFVTRFDENKTKNI